MTGSHPLPDACTVAVVGGGPAGLSAAVALVRAGVAGVHVLERESEAGGIPRHCGHPPFGMREFNRVLTGPRYARRMVRQALAAGVAIHTGATVVELEPGGLLRLSTSEGARELRARCVLLATGVRETPRSARLVSGARPAGVTTTGALQSTVYVAGRRLFESPVIIGSELVAFSALLTCRHAGIRPRAMIESGDRPTAWRWSAALAHGLGVGLRLNTELVRIFGTDRVEGVQLANQDGHSEHLSCDGVVFTGCFVPEASLLRSSHLAVDPGSGGPVVDSLGRCSDAAYFAAGNLLRAVETAGWCWHEGREAARHIAASLRGALPDPDQAVSLRADHPSIKYVVPQKLSPARGDSPGTNRLQLRVTRPTRGTLTFETADRRVYQRRIRALPERRIIVELPVPASVRPGDTIHVKVTGG